MLPFEYALFMYVNASPATHGWVIDLANWLTLILPMCLAGAVIGAFLFAPKPVQRDLLVAVAAMLLAALFAYVIRKFWPMARPAQLGWGIQWIEHSMRAAFPSMHATNAFALAQGLLLAPHIRRMPMGRWVIAAVWISAIGIAWSRVCLGVHSPSDVLGGAVLGIFSASLITMVIRLVTQRTTTGSASVGAAPVSVRDRFSTYSSHPALPWVRRR